MKAYSVLVNSNGFIQRHIVSANSPEAAKQAALNRVGGTVLGVVLFAD